MSSSGGNVISSTASDACRIAKKLRKKSISLKPVPKIDREDEEEPEILSFFMKTLTPRMEWILKHKLNETDENKEYALKAMKELIAKEENLYCRMDESFLKQFLRCKKYDVKKAFKMLSNYYAFKKEFHHIYSAYFDKVDKLQEVISRNYVGFLRNRDKFGNVVFCCKAGLWDSNVDSYEDIFCTICGCAAHAIEFEPTQVNGYRIIVDLRKLTWRHLKFCTPYNVYLIIRSSQHCFPARCKGIHIIMHKTFFNLIWAITAPFLTAKIKSRIHLYGTDLSGIQKFIDASVLPEEFGGNHKKFDNSAWKEEIDEEVIYQRSLFKYGYK